MSMGKCKSHKKKPNGYWTKERCHEEALKYNNRTKFNKGSIGAYDRSHKEGWLDEICTHMDIYKETKHNLEKLRCHEEALKYNTRGEFSEKSRNTYEKSRREGWLDEICTHMDTRFIWTYDKCKEEALKYNNRVKFNKGSSGAYNKSSKEGWLDEICKHMFIYDKTKINVIWTYDKCKEEALKYNTRSEFWENNHSACNRAHKKGWLDEICSHMKSTQKPNGYWTKERCHEEALKYNTRSEFQKESVSAYDCSLRNGLLDEICGHMILLRRPNNYWTKERCHEEALKYNTRNEFNKGSKNAYVSSLSKGWLDEICSHMSYAGSLKRRYIYSYEFHKTKSVYVGLTWCIEQRDWSHNNKTNSSVYKYMDENGLTKEDYTLVLHGDYDMTISPLKEKEKLQEYNNNGWNIINRAKTGGLGGVDIKWTYEKCKEEALKYNTRSEFNKGSSGAYNKSSKEGWLDEICSHMTLMCKPNGYWSDFENCKKSSLNYDLVSQWLKECQGAYKTSKEMGWLDDIYKINGWKKHNKTCEVVSYDIFKEWCRDNNLPSGNQYRLIYKDADIILPSSPMDTYKDEWNGWGDVINNRHINKNSIK